MINVGSGRNKIVYSDMIPIREEDEVETHLIVAMTKDRVIGNGNALPWHIPDEMKLFKDLTMGNVVIMGYNTYKSIPNNYLEGRTNIVITKKKINDDRIETFTTITRALQHIDKGNKVFFIGGAMLYEAVVNKVMYMHISTIKEDYKGNKYMPYIDYDDYVLMNTKYYPEFDYRMYKHKVF